MLGNQPFFHNLIRKHTAIFGKIFNDLDIQRYNEDGTPADDIRVKLTYAEKEKVMALLKGNPDLQRQAAVVLPTMAFELTAMRRDNSRALNPVQQRFHKKTGGGVNRMFTPVPWNFYYTLRIYFSNLSDGFKIIEQILPYFQPSFSVNANLIPEMEENMDILIEMDGTPSLQDSYDGDPKDRRYIVWTLDFVVRGYLYGPIKSGAVIKFVDVGFNVPNAESENLRDSPKVDRVTVSPGLTAGGEPTSNSALTIPWRDIESDDPYGFVTFIAGDLTANT